MKKITFGSLIFILAFSLLLSACGTQSNSGAEGEKNGDNKTLRVVTDANYAPFESMDKGEVVGFDIDFVKAVAEEAGYAVKIESVGWDPVFAELQSKSADLGVSAITINDDRKKTYDFSVPYFLSTQKILVPENSDIKSAEDLKGKRVAVQNATTGQEAAEGLLGKNSKYIKKFDNNNLAIMEMTSGGADAVVADNTVIEEYAKNNPNQKLKVIEDDTFENEYYGLMFPKDSELKEKFDKAINEVFDNGTYSKIYEEHFKIEPEIDLLKEQQ
ncbi:basic amino acid ABC transporter substrate-binding protein [Bacillus gobiensis]|uniref:basic amino acid ABC transporter substrate-binding protein n=1 Tax=Bacillus gobiensis TaxID=1441095 RepID=UPI003D1A5454